jgi:hypothetical protein
MKTGPQKTRWAKERRGLVGHRFLTITDEAARFISSSYDPAGPPPTKTPRRTARLIAGEAIETGDPVYLTFEASPELAKAMHAGDPGGYSIADTCCGKCEDSCYVDLMTGA